MAAAIVSVHDVAPSTFEQSRAWVEMLDRHRIRASLLVVPGPWGSDGLRHDPEFITWLHGAARSGHEVSLHGWEHRGVDDPNGPGPTTPWSQLRRSYGEVIARGCGEFHNLGTIEAKRRLRAGLSELRAAGFDPVGFTPPGWLASRDSVTAMRQVGLSYTTTQWAIVDLANGVRIPIPAVSQRPGSSLTDVAAAANEQIIRWRLEHRHSIRLALHPRDLDHQRLITSTERIFTRIDAARSSGLVVTTYRDLIERGAIARRRAALATPAWVA